MRKKVGLKKWLEKTGCKPLTVYPLEYIHGLYSKGGSSTFLQDDFNSPNGQNMLGNVDHKINLLCHCVFFFI